MLDCGCVETDKDDWQGDRLLQVYEGVKGLLDSYAPDELAIEKLFFSRNVTSAIAVAEARGVILMAAAQSGVPVTEYAPSEIKETMTGNGQARKKDMGQAVVITLGLDKAPTPDDTADAVAIAITHHFWSSINAS